MATKPPQLETAIQPRLLTRQKAADYCALSTQGFSEWIKNGRLPKPIPGTNRWDLKAINAALDLLSGIANLIESNSNVSEFDQWKSKHARTP
jgi:predicted DNA-binding transcriptional regulator AlpA